jgi:hypothetical protein
LPAVSGRAAGSDLCRQWDGACIDHIFMRVWKDEETSIVSGVSVVLDRTDPETGLLASDHFGVKASILVNATLQVQPAPTAG